jgi:isoleucyl-tRNA synthetase
LRILDKFALMQLSQLFHICKPAFESFEFFRAAIAITKWANLDFSAFYMESIKDRLYTESSASSSRLGVQTVLYHIYHHLQALLGPMTPMLIEEAWEHTPDAIKSAGLHPLKRILSDPPLEWHNRSLEADFPLLMDLNATVKQMQEVARSKQQMGSSLQSFVHLELPDEYVENTRMSQYEEELQDLFVVSSVTVSRNGEPVPFEVSGAEWSYSQSSRERCVHVYAPRDAKCARCWRYVVPETSTNEGLICRRCENAVCELDASVDKRVSQAANAA